MRSKDPVGPANDNYVLRIAQSADLVVAAWGNHGVYLDRHNAVRHALQAANVELHCPRIAKTGQPCHPLYLPYSLTPIPMPELPL